MPLHGTSITEKTSGETFFFVAVLQKLKTKMLPKVASLSGLVPTYAAWQMATASLTLNTESKTRGDMFLRFLNSKAEVQKLSNQIY